jgi:hypothetical protein
MIGSTGDSLNGIAQRPYAGVEIAQHGNRPFRHERAAFSTCTTCTFCESSIHRDSTAKLPAFGRYAMPEQLDALRQAAVTLLAAASPGAVLAATRALLNSWDENATPAAAGKPLQAVCHAEEAERAAAPAPPPAPDMGAPEAIPAQPTLVEAGAAYAAQRREEEAAWFSAKPAASPDSTALAEWENLRQRVREARQTRKISIQTMAERLGLAKTTLENTLQTRALPSVRMRQNLEQWLAAPEVAANETMFRGNGAGHAAGSDNDAGHVDAGV